MRCLLLLLFCCPLCLPAQTFKQDWEKITNASGRFHTVIEATNGYLFCVGETSTKTKGGTDGLLLIADHSTGQVAAELRFGGNKDDALFGVTQTFDGLFLLAGTTASAGKGNTDAWLLLVDERGQKIWETTYGTPGRDECRGLLRLPDGGVVLAGYQDGQKNGDIWLAKVADRQLLWEKTVGAGELETLGGLALASDGGIVFCGNTGKKGGSGSGDIYLAKTDAGGSLLWKKYFGEANWEEALDLIATRDGGFAIAGLTKSKGAGDLDAWLLKTSRDGFRQWDKPFGGKDADLAHALLQTDDGGFVLAGDSKSRRSGARATDAFLVSVSPGGELLSEDYYGKDKDDAFTALCLLHNGSLAFAGTFDDGTAGLLRYSDPQASLLASVGIRDAISIDINTPNLHTSDGSLTPGARSYLSFTFHNTSDLDLQDLRVSVDNRSSDLLVWNANYLGAVPKGATTEVRIPVAAKADFAPGEALLQLSVSSGNKTLKSIDKTLTLRKPQPAKLLIAGHRFEASGRSDDVTLTVTVENAGDSSSRAAELRFACPAGIRAVSATQQPLGVVGPHSRRELQLVFAKTAQFSAPVAAFVCSVQEGGAEKVRKTLEWQAAAGKSAILSNGPILIWTDPAPHETGTNKVRKTDDHFEFKMTVVSPKPLDPKNFKMKVNGVEMDGSKFNEEDLSPPRRDNAQYTYTYRNKIPLQQGNNRVEVLVDEQVSDALDVEFTPERANLFVLAIGPQHEDLQDTAKDARDFAAAFQNQGGAGKLFNQVVVRALSTPAETDLTAIKQAAYDLAYQWDDKQIKSTDLLLVFVSSHGKIVDNRFKILQTGYNPKYERLTVDFKTDLLEVLNNIHCKKLIFIDACHSGGAKDGFGGLSRAMVDLARAQPGVSTLTSCGSTEKSYEHAAWENGAFTEALLEAFAGKAAQDATGTFRADANDDRILRLGELYTYLQRRVPGLVNTQVPNAPTSQTPFMPESQLDKDLPLFFLEGH
ncbi:MAG: caspase family protein [Saprospiraceae bacterium]|nr:caspase family protein [Saprospiraceae bacterium]